MKRIEYLDLDFKTAKKNTNNVSDATHRCYFPNIYSHSLHSSSSNDVIKQLNSIVDLLCCLSISFQTSSYVNSSTSSSSSNLDQNLNDISRTLSNINSTLNNYKTVHNDLNNKLDYIKNQNSQIISTSPLKDDITTLTKIIKDNKPKEIETNMNNILEKLTEQVNLYKTSLEKELEQLKDFLIDIKKIILS